MFVSWETVLQKKYSKQYWMSGLYMKKIVSRFVCLSAVDLVSGVIPAVMLQQLIRCNLLESLHDTWVGWVSWLMHSILWCREHVLRSAVCMFKWRTCYYRCLLCKNVLRYFWNWSVCSSLTSGALHCSSSHRPSLSPSLWLFVSLTLSNVWNSQVDRSHQIGSEAICADIIILWCDWTH